MVIHRLKHFAIVTLVSSFFCPCFGQVTITAIENPGRISWSNQVVGEKYSVQWASSLTGTWSSTWSGISCITATGTSGSASVPMFYRVIRDPDDMIAHYPLVFDARDATTNANHGSISGAIWTNGCKSDATALWFDGNNDLVNCGTNSLFVMSNSFTLAAWIYLNSTNNPGAIVGNWITPVIPSGYLLCVFLEGNLELTMNNSYVIDYQRLSTGRWTHVAATYEQPIATLYVDGLPVATTSNFNLAMTNSAPLVIGNRGTTPNWPFSGRIDDVRVYNRALSDAEILWIAEQ